MGKSSAVAEADLSDFEAGGLAAGVHPCLVGAVLGMLDHDRAASLRAALVARLSPGTVVTSGRKVYRYSGERIAQVLTGWGHPLSGSTVDKHRRGGCGCPRDDR